MGTMNKELQKFKAAFDFYEVVTFRGACVHSIFN